MFLSVWNISRYCTYLFIKDKNKVTRNNTNPSRFRFSGEILKSLRNFVATMIFSVDSKIALHKRVGKLMLLAHVLLALSDVTSKCFANRCLKVLIKCFFACIADMYFQPCDFKSRYQKIKISLPDDFLLEIYFYIKKC